jgi:hypothetical protein
MPEQVTDDAGVAKPTRGAGPLAGGQLRLLTGSAPPSAVKE